MKSYSKYKYSGIEWVGDIPFGWKVLPLFVVADKNQRKNLEKKETTVLSLSYGNIIERDVESNFGLLPESFDTYQLVENGNIVLRLTDLQNDKNSLRVGLVKQQGIITSAYVGLIPKEMESRYIYYLLHNYDLLKVFYNFGSGVRQNMTFNDLKRLPIIYPELQEQIKISNYLDYKTKQIDKLIVNKKKLIELLKEERIAIINQAVIKGINSKAKLKPSGVAWLGDIPENWELKKIWHLVMMQKVEIQDGNHGSLYPKQEDFIEEGVFFIKPRDIRDGGVRFDTCDCISEEQAKGLRIGFSRAEDVLLVNRGGTIGRIAKINNIPNGYSYSIINPQMTYIRCIEGLNSDYVFYFCQSVALQESIELIKSFGSTFAFLGLSNMGKFPFLIPPLEEQKRIVEHISGETKRIDSIVSKAEQEIELLKEYKTALISEVVTGKLDVQDFNLN